MDEIGSYTVYVYAENRGRKRITGGDDVQALSMWIAGCFLSPHEPRMLTVIGRQSYVFEGTGAFFHFSGCHLGVGFN
jgi:hypothetical protein